MARSSSYQTERSSAYQRPRYTIRLAITNGLSNDVMNHVSLYIGQSHVATTKTERRTGVIETQ